MGMQFHVIVHPSLQVAKRKTQHRIRSGHAVWVFVELGLSLWRGGGDQKSLPLNEVFGFLTMVLEAAAWPECALLRCIGSGISEKKGCKG